ncbi:hypothetical protein [Peribacillus sp. SCS-155]|uniref:hypothetical protein n=1 Tax=Peribacillus sedimenti TaxID=3115297 RepID=UPI00390609F8
MNNKLLGTVAIGAAAYLMKNKDARETMKNQMKVLTNPQARKAVEDLPVKSRKDTTTFSGSKTANNPIANMSTKNKILGSLAIGTAAYLMRNKQSRDKVMNPMKSLGLREKLAQNKNRQSFLETGPEKLTAPATPGSIVAQNF